MRVDNTTTIAPAVLVNRPSVRITSQDAYGTGNIIIIDAIHIPYGCSVWPSFWTMGTDVTIWPDGGEIDIIEAINTMNNNQYALHTTGGCFLDRNTTQTGHIIGTDCSTGSGCVVAESKPNSFGVGFANAGGGVFVTQLDVSGVYFWFWSRPDIPDSIKSATSTSTIDPSTWGPPSASYPTTTCNYTQYFSPQQLVFTTTLCGVWAGVPSIYQSTCPSGGKAPNSCVADNVIGPGSPTYDEAYWEVSYVRTYLAAGSQPGAPSASSTSPSGTTSSSSSAPTLPTGSGTPKSSSSSSSSSSSAIPLLDISRYDLGLLFLTAVCAVAVTVL